MRKEQYNHLHFTEEKTEIWGAYRPIGSVDQTPDVSPQLLVLSPFLGASPWVSERRKLRFQITGCRGAGWGGAGAGPVSGAQWDKDRTQASVLAGWLGGIRHDYFFYHN